MFSKSKLFLAVVIAVVAVGCGSSNPSTDAGSQQDAGTVDTGSQTPSSDAGSVDAGSTDAGSTDAGSTGTSPIITIQNFTYTPLDMTVAAGTFIGVVNKDSAPHSVTSESAKGQFTPGGVAGISFDSGVLSSGQMTTISIPANAPSGTVIPFYCSVHKIHMPEGTITIQ